MRKYVLSCCSVLVALTLTSVEVFGQITVTGEIDGDNPLQINSLGHYTNVGSTDTSRYFTAALADSAGWITQVKTGVTWTPLGWLSPFGGFIRVENNLVGQLGGSAALPSTLRVTGQLRGRLTIGPFGENAHDGALVVGMDQIVHEAFGELTNFEHDSDYNIRVPFSVDVPVDQMGSFPLSYWIKSESFATHTWTIGDVRMSIDQVLMPDPTAPANSGIANSQAVGFVTPESQGLTLSFTNGLRSPNPRTLGYWRFEDGVPNVNVSGVEIPDSVGTHNGTLLDWSYFRNDVPIKTIPTTGATNAVSLQIPGGQVVAIPDPGQELIPTDRLTVEFWMKAPFAQPTGDPLVVDHSHGLVDSSGWLFMAGGGEFGFAVGQGGPTADNFPGAAIAKDRVFDNRWHHIAGTFDFVDIGREIKLYVDGLLVATNTATVPLVPNGRDVRTSALWNGWRPYSGYIDELRISNYALSPLEFLNLPGDYNGDGLVDSADYVVWRKYGGSAEEYDRWRSHFGQSAQTPANSSAASIPEPTSTVLFSIAAVMLGVSRFKTRRG